MVDSYILLHANFQNLVFSLVSVAVLADLNITCSQTPEDFFLASKQIIPDSPLSGKPNTIRESNHASGVRKAHCTKKLHFISRIWREEKVPFY